LPSRNGIEFIDLAKKSWGINHWVRSSCLYGVMPANGLLYTGPHDCACHPQAKLCGFNALAASTPSRVVPEAADGKRLTKGPAYDAIAGPPAAAGDWPVYRANSERSGATTTALSPKLATAWTAKLEGKLTQPVVQGDLLVAASVDNNTVYALDAATGLERWRYVAGGRVDSPPSLYEGRVVFGSADGYVTCLRAADGALAWRFRAAPVDRRLVAFGQVESVWPVHGSVLVSGGDALFVAGRSFHLDGGVRFYRLDVKTGEMLVERVMDHLDEEGVELQAKGGLDMPVALPDILSAKGDSVFMRAQVMDRDGNRRKSLEHHLFAPYGFVDDSCFHRAYWVYGQNYYGGCGGYPRAGKQYPSGRMVVFDDKNVYAYGREQKYYRWITPLVFHLFASPRVDLATSRSTDVAGLDSGGKKGGGKTGRKTTRKPKKRRSPPLAFAWSERLPLLVRAMAKSGDVLFLAGAPDLIDEEDLVQRLSEPKVMLALAEQDVAYSGGKGALLWAVSAQDGARLTENELDSLPTFDGMSVANGHLYIATIDGRLVAMKASP
jgi:hypothetical protein